jgi:hypothetical protein
MMLARRASRRANAHLWIGAGVCLGLVAVLGLGYAGVGTIGLFGTETAIVMLGGASIVLAVGFVASLFSARSALRAGDEYALSLAMEASQHADELSMEQSVRYEQADHAIDELSVMSSRQANAIVAMQGVDTRHESFLASLKGREDRLEVASSALEARLANEERLERNLEKRLETLGNQEKELTQRVGRDETVSRRAFEELAAERARLSRDVQTVRAEERERKEEFEALAAEEIRLMGRVRKAEDLARGTTSSPGENYRILHPKNADKHAFGDVYPVSKVAGINASRTARLKLVGITDTEELWRANPAFIAAALHCEPKTVEYWQEKAELMAISGIGREFADILVDAGITSIQRLGKETPEKIVERMAKESGPTATAVSLRNAEKWIEAAKAR